MNITLLQSNPGDGIFVESAICLQQSLRLINIPAQLHINGVDSSGYTIYFGAGLRCTPDVFQQIADPARSIIFNLEQLESRATVVDQAYLDLLKNYIVFDYHSSNVNYLKKSFNKDDAYEIPIVPCLKLINQKSIFTDVKKTSDFLFYGSINSRRSHIIDALRNKGYRVDVISDAYGHDLTRHMQATRCIIHIHYHESALFPAIRVLQPTISGIPVISEKSYFSNFSDWGSSGILFSEYEDFVQVCENFLMDSCARESAVQKTLALISRIDFEYAWKIAQKTLNI